MIWRLKMSDNENIGYGKPPKHTRFKKGQSGNPKGRPKGRSKELEDIFDLADAFIEECTKPIYITENGERVEIQMIQAVFKQALAKAIKGNMTAMKFVHNITTRSLQLKQTSENQRLKRGSKRLANHFIENMSDDDMHDVVAARYEKQEREAHTSDHDSADTADADGENMTEEEAMNAYMDDIQKSS